MNLAKAIKRRNVSVFWELEASANSAEGLRHLWMECGRTRDRNALQLQEDSIFVPQWWMCGHAKCLNIYRGMRKASLSFKHQLAALRFGDFGKSLNQPTQANSMEGVDV